MKNVQRNSFQFSPLAAAIAMAVGSQFALNVAHAGSGFGSGVNTSNTPVVVPTYYANSPAGPAPQLDANGARIDPATGLPYVAATGKALRKFVDTLPGMGAAKANNLGQYIPVAVAEKWVDGNGVTTGDDYYEIAAVEYAEKMHSDLPKATHLRGYVQLMTPGLAAKGVAATSFTTLDGTVLSVVDAPHHLGPIINSTKGTAVRVKFTNYLPTGAGGKLFIPVDTTITGAGLGPDGVNSYTQNRAEIHLVGGQSPWISAGSPHQWVAPAAEATPYTKGVSAQNVPDMADPGAGSTTLYFPNDLSARFMFYQDRTSGLTRLNSYAGLEAGYFVTDAAEQALVTAGTIPAEQIPLIIEDKTFVPANIAQQDAKWTWGQPGDLWFPHVYETNQDPSSVNGVNPVGRWDYGPLFWPIFPVTVAKATLPTPSFTPEAYLDTPVINGTAYPTLTVDPKAYRLRILNASNDRYINLGLYKADATVKAPQLDQNGNPTFDASGNQLFFTNTEVKMIPAAADVAGNPPGWDAVNGVQLPSPQYPNLPWNINSEPSGPSRAWPTDGRAGGAPDPATSGPDFIVIGNDGGLLPNPVDIPSQPVTYEQNRRSITVLNIYGYGMLLGPAERADAVVDFSAYAGQTLILYNDAPAPTPFNDPRNDYYTGNPDLTGQGGAYSTQPGYGPNTRTMMQIVVKGPSSTPSVAAATPFDAVALAAALPLAYGASQSAPIVPAVAYNAAFGTNDADVYAHVATGSIAQPNLDFSTSGALSITGLDLITSGGTVVAGGAVVGNATPGSGTGYDPKNPPTVVFNSTVNGVNCLPTVNGVAGVSAAAIAVVDQGTPAVLFPNGKVKTPAVPSTQQVTGFTNVTLGSGYVCAPLVTFTNPSGTSGVGAQAVVKTSNFKSIPVLTKAEQELFDDYGRYNSTGGVELPMTSGVIQTTIPLNYIDSPTEIIKDGEVQIWKLVDNGFWSNSIRFDMVDVQLINRVGWDGTVKAPATNEVGWKDTIRLNPLEDAVVAMRAKRPTVPFGLPASSRLQDPSRKVGAAGSGLGFTVDPAVTAPIPAGAPANAVGAPLLTTTTNVVANYDNEFTWGSAILGHAEDDFTRPVVFHPTVTKPDAPTQLGGSGGVLTWTDPTPAVAVNAGVASAVLATLANPKNEIGFKVLRATYSVNGNLGGYQQIGATPANVTQYTDATQQAGIDYAYEVVAWNNAGSTTSTPYTEITAPAMPTWVGAGAVVNANGSVTLTWNKVTGATAYLLSINGAAPTSIATAGQGATQSTTVTLTLGSVYSFTLAAQQVKFGQTATSTASGAVSADLTLPATPATPTVSAVTSTSITLGWTSVTGATGYTLQYSTTGGAPWSNVGTGNNGVRTTVASLGSASTSAVIVGLSASTTYSFQMSAKNAIGSSGVSGSVAQTTLATTPAAPAFLASSGVSTTGFTLNWNAPAGATSYVVNANGIAQPSLTGTSLTVTGASPGTSNVYTVAACNNNGATCATSTSLTQWTLPATPAQPTVSGVTASGVTVNWVSVTGATSYTVQRATVTNGVAGAFGNATQVNAVAGVLPTSLAVTGLNGNTTYVFQVRATGAAGNGGFSTSSAAQLTLPTVPNNVTASNGTNGGAFTGGLSFTPVAGLTYAVNWTAPAGVTPNTGKATVTTSGQQITFATAGTYSMTLTATNASGSSTSVAVNVNVR